MRTFFCPGPWQVDDTCSLPADEVHHARHVLRLGPGDALRLIDGRGGAGEATVLVADRHSLTVRVTSRQQVPEPPGHLLTVAVCAPKGGRLEDLVRGLGELGVGRIALTRAERSVRQPDTIRAQRVAIAASKQSGRASITEVTSVGDITTLAGSPGACILLDPAGGPPMIGAPGPTTLLIGPEGGVTDAERTALIAAGARPVRLAPTILRIETAAVAAAAVWIAAWEHHGRPADHPTC